MPSGKAFKVGDIINCSNSKSIGIHDASNAGVLLLSDAIIYGERQHKPKLVLNIATLTDGVQKGFCMHIA